MSEIMGIRGVLEAYAARLAATNASDEDLQTIAEYCNSSVMVDKSSSIENRATLNDEFHGAVARASHNGRLIKMIADFYEYAITEEMLAYYSKADTTNHAEQHRAILTALQNRDPDAADAAMRAHINSVGKVIETAIMQMKSK
jgi:GntR family transcriptional repressor for pyruvate dehydrogenase complex